MVWISPLFLMYTQAKLIYMLFITSIYMLFIIYSALFLRLLSSLGACFYLFPKLCLRQGNSSSTIIDLQMHVHDWDPDYKINRQFTSFSRVLAWCSGIFLFES